MSDINLILSSSNHYRQAFEVGLIQILQYKTAGTFILACANFFQHPQLLKSNKALLREIYQHIKEHYQACLRDGWQPDDAPDDIAVMNSLMDIGLDNLEAVDYRKVNYNGVNYLLNYNQLRSFRPARMSKAENIQLNSPFNTEGFHFNKPFLEKEIFAEGVIDGKQVSLLYNKFPFIDYHALLVVDKTRQIKQYLTQDALDYIVNLQNHVQQNCPGFVIAYNSLGAGASVNHLHFHTYLESTPLAIFSSLFMHNGGDRPYPAYCQVFTSTKDAWKMIESLHDNNTPYNLLIKDNLIYCLPRKLMAGNTTNVEMDVIDTSVFGWSQMAGLINVDNSKLLTGISANRIISALERVSSWIE